MGSSPKSGILTFLFTDLEDSTRLWEQFPQVMQPALTRHDDLLKQAVEDHSGFIVKSRGDGIHAAFESPADGVAAALAAQQALSREIWPEETGPFRVRMGLHSGVSQERDGDYYGTEPNRAARIMDLAYGGQVLISEVTAALIRNSLPPQAGLVSLGAHRLKGLANPEEIYQLHHPTLRAEFPALRSLEAYQHNLPVQLTSFIGRENELAQIKGLFSQTRLLTLLGPGGTGKTRLSLQFAAGQIEQFPDGVWLIELAPLTNPDLIPERVAAALNVEKQPGQALLDTLINYLRNKKLLLLLDNVEHLVRESAQLAEQLLGNCPAIKILVTGREALFIAGEQTLQIPSLSMPERGKTSFQEVNNSEAAQLLVARAQAVRPDFDITPENAGAVGEIVRRLDGIPLAIELAAARLRMMTVEQIASKLAHRFRLLTGGRRTALPRQQTLEALIDWSWNLLDEQERILLRRLSVFSGGWTLEAAQAVTSDDQLDEFDVLDLLGQLINKSLVNVEQLPKEEIRYNMLETIRQYARKRLLEASEVEAIRNRHAAYYVAFGDQASVAVEGPEALLWLDRLLREADNASAAREWALESRLDLALKMTNVSMLVLRYWLFNEEGFHWLDQVVEQTRLHPPAETDPEYQRGLASALIAHGTSIFMQGKTIQARPLLEEGVALAKEIGAVKQQVFGLNMLLPILLNAGDLESAETVAQQALDLSRQHDLTFLRQMTLGYYMPVFASQGKHEQAQAYTEEAIQLAQQHGNPWMVAMASFLKGRSEEFYENWPEAAICYLRASQLFEAVRDRMFALISQSEAGHSKRKAGDFAGAEEIYRKTVVRFQEIGHKSGVAHQLECIAMIAASKNQPQRAARLLGAAQSQRAAIQSIRLPREQVEFDQTLARLGEGTGKGVVEAAMAEGRQLSIEEAVLLALGEPV
ncbi:MAG: adenylate/guanylate cyclase domain-containing protein [Anaerolineales bacterium]|jgi:predicted ATPase/class 3 adenylate cyclase